jgi:predicted RNA-binding Zn ribbon-like protein
VISEPLTGEPLALDLVNTVASPPGGDVDLLDSADDLRAWLAAERHRLDITDGRIDLGAVRALRAHITSAVEAARAGTPPPSEALRAITDAQRNAPAYRELGWNGQAITVATRRPGNATAVLLAQLAEAAATLLASPAISLVRRCEGPGCRMLFLPAHPRRRWCSPATCGNRARVARYYQRHRELRRPAPTSGRSCARFFPRVRSRIPGDGPSPRSCTAAAGKPVVATTLPFTCYSGFRLS